VHIGEDRFYFEHVENSFTQPNPYVNEKIITWLLEHLHAPHRDLLELYCGMGNLTLPLARRFRKVLASEISKTSIRSALKHCEMNHIDNITFLRMSSEEVTQALTGVRTFRRLEGLCLDDYDFGTVLVDPPRAGLDAKSLQLVQHFDHILYISCNPETLHENLITLQESHSIEAMALFDQFAYTKHAEMGVILKRR